VASSLEVLALAKLSFWDNKPTASLYNTSNSFTVPNNSFAAITWNNSQDDNWGGHSNVTNPSRYTAQVAGVYRFSGAFATVANATGYRLGGWALNGAEYASGNANTRVYNSNPSGTVINSVSLGTVKIRMNVGDYVEMWVFQNSGGTLATTDGTWMDVEFSHF
jgi:hypothetical protein